MKGVFIMATRKVYEVRAVNPYTDQRVFELVSAVSVAQAEYFFKQAHGFYYVGFDTRESCRVGGPMQLSLF